MAEEVMELDEDTQKDKYLTFFIGKEIYGIDIRLVTEIIGIQPITEIPEVPEYVKGIINLRGKIIPVMDVRLRFKKEFLAYNDRTCVIVIEAREFALSAFWAFNFVCEEISSKEEDNSSTELACSVAPCDKEILASETFFEPAATCSDAEFIFSIAVFTLFDILSKACASFPNSS